MSSGMRLAGSWSGLYRSARSMRSVRDVRGWQRQKKKPVARLNP
ncbi:MAG: hypothetical protein ACM3TR_09945 [Caulobacteraceae bacterium]